MTEKFAQTVVVTLVVALLSAPRDTQQSSLNDPALTVLAKVGQRTVLPCQSASKVLWTYYNASASKEEDIANGDRIFPKFASRYKMEVTPEDNKYNLVITNTEVEQSGMYSCLEDGGVGDRSSHCLLVRAGLEQSETLLNPTTVDSSTANSSSCQTVQSPDRDTSNTSVIVVTAVVTAVSTLLVVVVVFLFLLRRRFIHLKPTDNERKRHGHLLRSPATSEKGVDLPKHRCDYGNERPELEKSSESTWTTCSSQQVNEGLETFKITPIKAIVDDAAECSGIFISLKDNLYFICPKHKQLHIYNFDEKCRKLRDIMITGIVQPCGLTENSEQNCIYFGDSYNQVIYRVCGEEEKVAPWLEYSKDASSKEELLSLSCISDGRLAVLLAEKCWDNRSWKNYRLVTVDTNGSWFWVPLPENVKNPWSIQSIRNDRFILSYGQFEACGVVMFDLNGNVTGDHNAKLRTPYFMQFETASRALIVVYPDTEEIIHIKLTDDCQLGAQQTMRRSRRGNSARSGADRRPVRVHYDSVKQLMVVGMENGDISLYKVQSSDVK